MNKLAKTLAVAAVLLAPVVYFVRKDKNFTEHVDEALSIVAD